MALYGELPRSRLSLISAEPDPELDAIAATIRPSLRVAGCDDVERQLVRLAASAPSGIASRTLDLIGHSTAAGLLQLGDWTIDVARSEVAAWFQTLARHDVLSRLGIRAVRLLGCHTARPGPARATLDALAALLEVLGVEVYGTDQLLHRAHYDAHGFRDEWRFLLVRASAAPGTGEARNTPCAVCSLDLDALPAAPREGVDPGAARVVTAATARDILGLIRCDAGARMPATPPPLCELALPSDEPGMYRVAHVLLDGAFVRFYPDGIAAPGVVYPVENVERLRRIVADLGASGAGQDAAAPV
jgi:hypothetical protein